MKKLLLLALLTLSTLFVKSQSTSVIVGNSVTMSNNRGGYGMDSVLAAPFRGRSVLYTLTRLQGRIQVNSTTNLFEWHDGTNWHEAMEVTRATDSITAINSRMNSKVSNARTINGYSLSNNINLSKTDISLGNVDNTSDLNKPLSNADIAASALKENLSNKQTNLTPGSGKYPTVDAVNSGLILKQDLLVSGTNIKTINGNSILGSGSLNIKSVATYSGVTNASGQFIITFPSAYSTIPNIQANIIDGTDSQNIRTITPSTTGVTILVRNRVDVVGLLPTWINVTGAKVNVQVAES